MLPPVLNLLGYGRDDAHGTRIGL